MLFQIFNDVVDEKLDERLKPMTEFDYFDSIVKISDTIGLEKNVSEDMYVLAEELISKIK